MLRLIFSCCLAGLFALPEPAHAQSEAELAKATLRALQEQSIRNNREYCGLIWRDGAGKLVAGAAERGNRARCRYPFPPAGTTLVATYHTHGAFLERFDNEVPSVLDVIAELSTGTNGYVSTPGGRFWFVDGKTGDIQQLCGAKCLPWDSRYVADLAGPVARKYTLEQLKFRQRRR